MGLIKIGGDVFHGNGDFVPMSTTSQYYAGISQWSNHTTIQIIRTNFFISIFIENGQKLM